MLSRSIISIWKLIYFSSVNMDGKRIILSVSFQHEESEIFYQSCINTNDISSHHHSSINFLLWQEINKQPWTRSSSRPLVLRWNDRPFFYNKRILLNSIPQLWSHLQLSSNTSSVIISRLRIAVWVTHLTRSSTVLIEESAMWVSIVITRSKVCYFDQNSSCTSDHLYLPLIWLIPHLFVSNEYRTRNSFSHHPIPFSIQFYKIMMRSDSIIMQSVRILILSRLTERFLRAKHFSPRPRHRDIGEREREQSTDEN